MSRVFFDSMLFVYWIEDHPHYGPRVRHIVQRMEERGDTLCTSALAVGEVLVGPHRRQAHDVVEQIRQFFAAGPVEVLAMNLPAAFRFGRIRSQLGVSSPDAVNLACAAESGVDLFLTNDAALVGKVVPGIQFVAGLNTDLF